MITVFSEYKINEEMRKRFLTYMQTMEGKIAERGGKEYRFLEGMDQPNLFVEMFQVDSHEQYQAIKAWRQEDDELAGAVAGGKAKIHIWAFAAPSDSIEATDTTE
ncbi:MFS transporter [Brevibacillus dissolubilis]|uniref:MFS transporter n=1 Tax=Brevibacillus dissolubilis TaxID=1844116 RepID=UPI001116D4F8|nr:MFS transporter [Brevibacillus dissolubilis]